MNSKQYPPFRCQIGSDNKSIITCELFLWNIFVAFYIALSISDFLILFFPDFRQILFLFIYLMHPCTWFIFCTVLTVSLMTGLSSFGALPPYDIVFTWDFSVFFHSIFLDSILGNYNGMKELFEKRKKASPAGNAFCPNIKFLTVYCMLPVPLHSFQPGHF